MRYIEIMETKILSCDEMYVRFPRRLNNEDELIDYALEQAGEWADEIDPHLMRDLFGDSGADLRLISLAGLEFNGGAGDDAKVEDYAALDTCPPPIIVQGKQIIDGNHRVRAARRKGETHIWAYVMFSTDDPL